METSYSRDLFFCAGSTARDASGRSEGMLAAVTFDRSMNLVVEKVLDRLDIQACTAIRRFPGTDDLAVGCFRDLFIVSWAGDDFIINNVIKNVHTNIFADIAIYPNRIYSVCQQDPYVAQTMYSFT